MSPSSVLSQIAIDAAIGNLVSKQKPIDRRPDDPVGWIETHFRIPPEEVPDMHLHLADYQRVALKEALSRDRDGLFKYSVVLWGDIKKSIKSCIAAAVILWRAWHTGYSRIHIVANDLKQADSRVMYYLRRAVELHPELAAKCHVKPSGYTVEFPNRTIVEAVPVDPKGEAGSNDIMIEWTELWGATTDAHKLMWCFDEQTEVLTLQGWRDCQSLSDTDDVACFNPATESIEWHKPKAIYRGIYVGQMHLYENATFSHCVTPNHRLFGQFSGGMTKQHAESHPARSDRQYHCGFIVSQEMRENFEIFYPRTSVKGYQSFDVSDGHKYFGGTKFKQSFAVSWEDWCEYAGWFVSEGYVRHNKNKQGEKYPTRVTITQEPKVHADKCERIRALHESMFGTNVGFRVVGGGQSYVVHSSEVARECLSMGNTSYEKRVPLDIKNTYPVALRRFLDAYLLGDGTRSRRGMWSATTHSKQLADDLMEIGIRLGYTMSLKFSKSTGGYRLYFGDGKDGYSRMLEKDGGGWKIVSYRGLVWCPSTPTGAVITRRNGTVCISGNTEMATPPNLFGKSMRWVDSYAGFSGESQLLEQLYDLAVKPALRIHPEYELYANPAARMFALWNTTPRLSWQTDAYYQSEAVLYRPSEFNRIHRNQWSSPIETFVPIEWWLACRNAIELATTDIVVGAVDGAVSNDSFGITLLSKKRDKTYIRYARCWYPPPGGEIDFVGTPENPGPELEIVRLNKEYHVIDWVYDMTHIADMMSRLRYRHSIHANKFSQGNDRLVADKALYDAIRDRRIVHSGEPDLTEHVMNSRAEIPVKGHETLRIVKGTNPQKKIDLCVAASMANYTIRETYNIS